MLWLQFALCAGIIVFAGTRLTVYADILSDRLNLGKVWVGAILLGLVTSLPEAVATITAVVQLHAVDLAIGNLVGSNNFNPLLIVLMDALYRKGSLTNEIKANPYHEMSGSYSIGMSLLVIVGLVYAPVLQRFAAGHIGIIGILIFATFLYGMRKISGEQVSSAAATEAEEKLLHIGASTPMSRIYAGLFFNAVLVVIAAIWLANVADTIARVTGLGGTFVGSFFLAITTSLPELVVSIQSVKMRAWDLAIGNIFGSNMTNTSIIFFCDAVNRSGPILFFASKAHILTVVLSIILSVILLIGIRWKTKKTLFGMGWDSILMLVVYIAGTSILYSLR